MNKDNEYVDNSMYSWGWKGWVITALVVVVVALMNR